MKKIIPALFVLCLFFVLALGNMGGCGDNPCDFSLNAFFNGTSIDDQTSEWDCKRGGETVFTLALFGDLTGIRSDIGEFVFDRPKCRVIEFENEAGTGKLKQIEGTIVSQGDNTIGSLGFKQVSDDFGDTEVGCELVEF